MIKAVTRRGDKPDHDIRPKDAAAVFAIADILTGLHREGLNCAPEELTAEFSALMERLDAPAVERTRPWRRRLLG